METRRHMLSKKNPREIAGQGSAAKRMKLATENICGSKAASQIKEQ